jgi:hypothetical protein
MLTYKVPSATIPETVPWERTDDTELSATRMIELDNIIEVKALQALRMEDNIQEVD